MECLVARRRIRFIRRTFHQHGSGSTVRSSTAITIIASEGFRIKFAGHCRRDFSMYRYPGLFVGLPPQYLLLQVFYGASWEYTRTEMAGMCWANDRTSRDKMMSGERHISFVDEPNTGVGQGKVHPLQYYEKELTGSKLRTFTWVLMTPWWPLLRRLCQRMLGKTARWPLRTAISPVMRFMSTIATQISAADHVAYPGSPATDWV